MKIRILSTCLLVALLNPAFTSCKKKTTPEPEPEPVTQPPAVTRNVRYEITGNYSGPLFVVYNDNVSGNTTLTVSTLPWRKDVTYSANVQGIGISSNSANGQQGAAGQTASLKIYVGNTIVQSSNAVADVNGSINLPPLAYVFP
jgi:hypothetical protein